MNGVPWKKVARALCQMHEVHGAANITRTARPLFYGAAARASVVPLSKDEELLRVPGRRLDWKEVTRWLWQKRRARSMRRPTLVVWSLYDEEEDESVVGVAAIVRPTRRRPAATVADRYRRWAGLPVDPGGREVCVGA